VETFESIVEALDSHSNPRHHLSHQVEVALKDAILSVGDTKRTAKVTIEILVTRDERRSVLFSAEVKSKIPGPGIKSATLWTDGQGRLFDHDPEQPGFDFDSEDEEKEAGEDGDS
jgi:hypothetical protein